MNDSSLQNADTAPEWSDDELIPFGKYVLLDRMSIGATAAVYRANIRGEAGFERLVAIKRILPHMAGDSDFVETFVREAKTVAKLAHEGICPIYELGKVGESLYMAIEYIQGRDLGLITRRLKKRGEEMPPLIAAWIAARLCDALDYAHTLKNARGTLTGMIHRDISPTNIILSYEGQVKLVDFGLAKAVGRAQSTNVDALKKKLSYMSPEMVKGKPLDARSDLFGVGVCFYEMITGRRLFVGQNDIDTLGLVGRASVLPPSAVMDDAPEDLEVIIMRALQREPADRFQTAAEMSEALHVFIARSDPTFGPKRLSDWMEELFARDIEEEQQRIKVLLAASKDAALIKQRAAFFASPSGAAARARAELEQRLSSDSPPRRASSAAVPKAAKVAVAQEPTGFEDEPTQMLLDAELMPVAEVIDSGGFDEEPTEIFFNKEEGVGMQSLIEEFNQEQLPAGPLNRPIVAPELRATPTPAAPPVPRPQPPSGSPARSLPAPMLTPSVPPRSAAGLLFVAALALLLAIGALVVTTRVGVVLGLREPPTGAIEVRTNPPVGANVKLDGVFRGHAPSRIAGVQPGARQLVVEAQGFVSISRQIQIGSGGTAVLDLALVPARPATPPPESSVPAAAVPAPAVATPTPTGQAAPAATPATLPETNTARSPTRERPRRAERRAAAQSEQSGTAGMLAISSVPWSYVTIDGRETGRNTPLLRYAIAPGIHEIQLRTPTGATHVQRIEVRPGQTVRVYHRF